MIRFLSLLLFVCTVWGACPPYPVLLNGQMTWLPGIPGDTPANTYMNASCISMYVLSGQSMVVCGRDNVWYGCPPHCNAPCPVPTPVLNAANTFSNAATNGYVIHGTVLTIQCTVPYRQSGDSTFTCNDGQWKGNVFPTCIEACEENIPLPDGSYTYSNTAPGISPPKHMDSSTLTISCNPGYILEGPGTLTCAEGFWIGGPATCYAPCPAPSTIANANPTFSTTALPTSYYTHGTVMSIACNGYYRLRGSSKMQCNDGTWYGSLPTCEAPCSSLTAPANGAVDYSDVDGVNGYHQDGAAATFSCRGDFVINGCGVSTCVDGYWTNSVPQCYSPCGNVTVTTNAAVQYSATTATNLHPHGSLLVPSCGGSSQLASTEKMMCYNGNWIGSLPTCLSSCPPLNNVDYRNVTYTTFFNNGGYGDGTVAYFSCYSYDVTDEASILTCTDGTWTGSSECKASCKDIESIPHVADVVYYEAYLGVPANTHAHGSRVQLICENSYHLVGPLMNFCRNGHWDNKLQWCRGPRGSLWWWPWLLGFFTSLVVGGFTCSYLTKAIRHRERLDDFYTKSRPLWFW